MQRYIADVETNGLLDQLTTIHCLWLKDPETGEKFDYADQPGHTPIREGLARLTEADVIIGHKLIAFDIKAIQKVYPDWTYKGSLLDTLILSQMLWPEIKKIDHKRRATGHTFPGKLIGRHGLEAWGWRLGLHKGDYAKECKTNGIDPWAEWNPSMHDYCGGDVDVTDTVLKRAEKRLAEYDQIVERENAAALSIEIECRFAHIISEMEHGGFPFNEGKAAVLYAELCDRRQALHEELTDIFPPKDVCTPFTPKANNSKLGYRKGVPTVKRKIVEFNPNSRQMIADRLIEKYGWKPDAYGKDGVPQLDDEVLSTLPYPEAKPLSEYMLVTKRIGQLAEGRVALLKAVGTDGRIHGRVDTVGTVTRRCTHKHPNVAQVPSVDAEYGEQFRELFEAPEGYVLVGADASGLELRCLAHYMAEFDGGKYAAEVVDGDVHTKNQTAAGLPTRGNAKTFI